MRHPPFIALVVLVCALAGCAHGEPLSTPETGTVSPLVAGLPTRLTYNPGVDKDAAWLPDESAVIYSADRFDRDDDDRCLVLLPPSGGRVTRTLCNESLPSRDSINTFDAPAVSPSGRVAFVRTSRPPNLAAPRFNELVLGILAGIEGAAAIRTIPFTLGTQLYTGVAQLRWLDGRTLVYRAGYAGNACIGPGAPCPRALVESGIGIVRHDSGGVPTLLPGTANASSVTVLPGGDAILFTVIGDGRVFRLVVSTGAVSTFFDLGAGIARDVQFAGSRLVAIVGGSVQVLDPSFNPPGTPPLQYDLGGDLVVVDLSSGATLRLIGAAYRRPALSPGGTRLVVERDNDLWLFGLP